MPLNTGRTAPIRTGARKAKRAKIKTIRETGRATRKNIRQSEMARPAKQAARQEVRTHQRAQVKAIRQGTSPGPKRLVGKQPRVIRKTTQGG